MKTLEAGAELKILLDAHFRIERAVFGHVADAAADLDGLPKDIESVNRRLT